jgi:hypothetical protein
MRKTRNCSRNQKLKIPAFEYLDNEDSGKKSGFELRG